MEKYNPRKGISRSEETKQKVRENHARYWKGKKHSEEHNRKISESMKGKKCYWYGKKHSDENKKKISLVKIDTKRPLEIKQKISQSLKGRKKLFICSENTKEKRRMNRLKQIENSFGGINFNKKACGFGYNLQHALNGKEKWIAGYAVDGFDEKLNIVFEYDERHHYYVVDGKLKPKDILGQQRIIDSIKPNLFIRYDEHRQRLYDAISEQELSLIL
jgi:hypothetical protein